MSFAAVLFIKPDVLLLDVMFKVQLLHYFLTLALLLLSHKKSHDEFKTLF